MKELDFTKLFKKIKQKNCIKAIMYILDANHLSVYLSGNKIMTDSVLFISEGNDIPSLYAAKKCYAEKLEAKIKYYTTENRKTIEELLIYKPVQEDVEILEKLSNNFINVYDRIVEYIIYIEKNKHYLTEEQKDTYLSVYYKYIDLDNKITRKLVRSVK